MNDQSNTILTKDLPWPLPHVPRSSSDITVENVLVWLDQYCKFVSCDKKTIIEKEYTKWTNVLVNIHKFENIRSCRDDKRISELNEMLRKTWDIFVTLRGRIPAR